MDGSVAGGLAYIIIAVLTAAGYAGLLSLMAAESACLPLPSEVILPFAGYHVSQREMNLYLVATVAVRSWPRCAAKVCP